MHYSNPSRSADLCFIVKSFRLKAVKVKCIDTYKKQFKSLWKSYVKPLFTVQTSRTLDEMLPPFLSFG